jgi:hypothetical protein
MLLAMRHPAGQAEVAQSLEPVTALYPQSPPVQPHEESPTHLLNDTPAKVEKHPPSIAVQAASHASWFGVFTATWHPMEHVATWQPPSSLLQQRPSALHAAVHASRPDGVGSLGGGGLGGGDGGGDGGQYCVRSEM